MAVCAGVPLSFVLRVHSATLRQCEAVSTRPVDLFALVEAPSSAALWHRFAAGQTGRISTHFASESRLLRYALRHLLWRQGLNSQSAQLAVAVAHVATRFARGASRSRAWRMAAISATKVPRVSAVLQRHGIECVAQLLRKRGKGNFDKQELEIVVSRPRSLAAAWNAKLQCRKSRGRPGDTIPSDISCKCCSQLWSKVDGCNLCIVCLGLRSAVSMPRQ